MPLFEPGGLVTRQVSYTENMVRLSNARWVRVYDCQFVTKNLTGFTKWYKERVDASVSTG